MKGKMHVFGSLLAVGLIFLTACGKTSTYDIETTDTKADESTQDILMTETGNESESLHENIKRKDAESESDRESETMILIDVNGKTLEAELADNSSARALLKLIEEAGTLSLDLHDYAGIEKVGSLPESLPTNDEGISTDYGDIILYQGNQFVLYYDTNSWTFTRLGHVKEVSKKELKEILGAGDVNVTLRISNERGST